MDALAKPKRKPWQFSLKSIDDLKTLAGRVGVSIPISEDASILAQPVKVGNLTAPNSLAIHPMEGCDADSQGRPGPLTIRRYERFAGGGAGLIWAGIRRLQEREAERPDPPAPSDLPDYDFKDVKPEDFK